MVCGKQSIKGKLTTNMGDGGKIEIGAFAEHVEFARLPFREYRTGALNRRKICLHIGK